MTIVFRSIEVSVIWFEALRSLYVHAFAVDTSFAPRSIRSFHVRFDFDCFAGRHCWPEIYVKCSEHLASVTPA
jgi:hypothetical protein